MSLLLALSRPNPILPRARLALDHLSAAAKKIFDRWPDIVPPVLEKDQEQIVLEMDERFKKRNWKGTSVAKVVRAARVLFSQNFRRREEFRDLRHFYLDEIRANPSKGFINSMFSVYLTSYEPGCDHTVVMSQAFAECRSRLGARWQQLLVRAPEVLDPEEGSRILGVKIAAMDPIWNGLRQMGFSAPHAPGIIDHAHLHYLRTIGSRFSEWGEVERLLLWLKPGNGTPRMSGATQSIEAVLHPWLKKECPDDFRDRLLERLVSLYGDPRISQAAHWIALRKEYRDLLHRWLTKADMAFFIEVVNRTQPSHMWPPRRDFWMRLYQQGHIDAAWVAFCPDAAYYARQHLISNRELDVAKRFGKQVARGSYGSTSLLIMKIGRKIVVDGCHSYKTHIFDENELAAPRLFLQSYDCYNIRDSSTCSKTHNPIENWKSWALMNVLSGGVPPRHTVTHPPEHAVGEQQDAKPESGIDVATERKAASTIDSYGRRLLETPGAYTAAVRIQLFKKLQRIGAVLSAEMVEDERGHCFLVLKCRDAVTVVDATHYLNTRIIHPDSMFSDQWRALNQSRRAALLSRWNYTMPVTQAPPKTFVDRFFYALRQGLGLTSFGSR
jgi:hypothetical protein